jgi:hypothetical protein
MVLVAACGKVANAPNTTDAALDAFACPAQQLLCGATCVDTTSDPMNCGACGRTCQAGTETCQAGVCVDVTATCADIHRANPNASDGQYTLVDGTVLYCDMSGMSCSELHGEGVPDGPYQKLDGSVIYCDMRDGGVQLYGVAYGAFDAAVANYTIISLSDFQSPGLQQVFIDLFNAQGGAALIAPFMASNCCFKYDATTGASFLALGINFLEPASVGGVPQCGGATDALEAFSMFPEGGGASTPEVPPLPANLFAMYPPNVYTGCSVSGNPAFFWKVTP